MRGEITDMLFIGLILFVAGLSFIFAYTLNTAFVNNDYLSEQLDRVNTTILVDTGTGLKSFDEAFLFLGVGLIIGTGISAFFARSHPVFFILFMILMAIYLIIGVMFSNVFNEAVNQELLIDSANEFPNVVRVLQNLPIFLLIGGVVISIGLFAGWTRGGSQGY